VRNYDSKNPEAFKARNICQRNFMHYPAITDFTRSIEFGVVHQRAQDQGMTFVCKKNQLETLQEIKKAKYCTFPANTDTSTLPPKHRRFHNFAQSGNGGICIYDDFPDHMITMCHRYGNMEGVPAKTSDQAVHSSVLFWLVYIPLTLALCMSTGATGAQNPHLLHQQAFSRMRISSGGW
jgi:hypothetical protein